MAKVTFADVKKAHEAAKRLGFRKTGLMLEGLRDRLLEMGERQACAGSAQHVLAGIDCIRHVMKAEEMVPETRKEFRWRRMNRALERVLFAGIVGTVAVAAAAEMGRMFGAERASSLAIATMGAVAAWEMLRSVADALLSTRERLIVSVRTTLTRLEADVREYAASEKKQPQQAPQADGQG